MKSKTSPYYISVETKSKHFPVFKYEYVKKGKEMHKNPLTSSLTYVCSIE